VWKDPYITTNGRTLHRTKKLVTILSFSHVIIIGIIMVDRSTQTTWLVAKKNGRLVASTTPYAQRLSLATSLADIAIK